MAKQLLPTVSVLSNRNAHDRFLSKEREEVVLIGYIDNNDGGHNTTFYGAAEKLHEDYPLGITSDPAAAQAAGVSFPSLVLYKPNGEGNIVFDKEWTVDEIKAFPKTAYTPLIAETGSETWRRLVSGQDGPTAFLFHKTDAERKRLLSDLRPVARRFQGQINFATAEIPDFLGFAGYLHLPDQPDDRNYPALAIYDGIARRKYPFSDALTQKNVEAFVQQFLANKIKPTIKSEAVPTTYEGPITRVVANTYDDIVMDTDKDVLVYYFREDCPYCKAMNPVYETLGSMYALPDRKERVVIAKYDIIRNDLFEDIPYVPFVKLYRAGSHADKTYPVIYTGDRSLRSLADFVKDQGTHKVDALLEHDVAEDAVHAAGDAMGAAGAQQQQPLGAEQLHGQPLQGRTPVRHIHDEL